MIEIKDSYFKAPDGNRYFRRNSLVVELGSYGEIKTHVFEINYLDVAGHIRYGLLDGQVKETQSVEIDWERENKADVEGEVQFYFDLNGRHAFTYEEAKEAHLKLVMFYIEQGDLQRVLNNDANIARNAMEEEGNDARLCSRIWVLMRGTLAEHFDTAVSFEVSATVSENLSITAQQSAGSSGSETIEFVPGCVWAYALHKVTDWDGDIIDDMELEFQGIG